MGIYREYLESLNTELLLRDVNLRLSFGNKVNIEKAYIILEQYYYYHSLFEEPVRLEPAPIQVKKSNYEELLRQKEEWVARIGSEEYEEEEDEEFDEEDEDLEETEDYSYEEDEEYEDGEEYYYEDEEDSEIIEEYTPSGDKSHEKEKDYYSEEDEEEEYEGEEEYYLEGEEDEDYGEEEEEYYSEDEDDEEISEEISSKEYVEDEGEFEDEDEFEDEEEYYSEDEDDGVDDPEFDIFYNTPHAETTLGSFRQNGTENVINANRGRYSSKDFDFKMAENLAKGLNKAMKHFKVDK